MPASTLLRVAPAKINLGLHVLRRRGDGYHDVETVMVPIGWADELRATAAPALTLSCSDPALPTDDRNLVMRAARALAQRVGMVRGAALELDKRVPYGAGLGGGSSDAAATLLALVDLWDAGLDGQALHALAADLGSDVPFFLESRAALAMGRGDVLRPIDSGDSYVLPYDLVVAVPPVRVATVDAYRMVTPRVTGRPDLVSVVLSNDLQRWKRELANDFQAPVAAAYPEVSVALAALDSLGADYAALSGSGSAVFGVFGSAGSAAAAGAAMREAGCTVWVESRARG